MILIVHTIQYRNGSDKFERIAETMEREISARYEGQVKRVGILGKRELTDVFLEIDRSNNKIDEYHFIGHAGMYGPMYGTVQYPEQYSPHELRNLNIPFSENAQAYFHCCRSARWFAPFFARTFQVTTHGYHWYTAFSASKTHFKRFDDRSTDLYAAGCKGRKSHGLMGSLKKHFGNQPLEPLVCFTPKELTDDTSYNKVAAKYAKVFEDIRVRKDEFEWINNQLAANKSQVIVDIGCGNGALLKALSSTCSSAIGLDVSTEILKHARLANEKNPHLQFKQIDGPKLPLDDQSADVIISMLSFRYLDWDPLMEEIKRVLKPGGKILIVDMVTVPPKWTELPALLRAKLAQYGQRKSQQQYYKNLKTLVDDPA